MITGLAHAPAGLIAVTGAGGKTGRAIVQALRGRTTGVRTLVRSALDEDLDRQSIEVIVGDMRDRVVMDRLLDGAAVVYQICPNMHPEELSIGEGVLTAARRAGSRLVYHSVLHPQTVEMDHHWQKMRVEAAIFKSGLPFTILQPAVYMQNVLVQRQSIVERGEYLTPYASLTRLGMVDLLDVAEAAARVLTESGHEGATYELAGAEVLDQNEVAAFLGDAAGRPVRAVELSRAEWAAAARRDGATEYAVKTLLAMFAYYEAYGFWGNPTVLRHLIRRGPTTMAAFVQREFAGAKG